MVVGGFAVIADGFQRFTKDLRARSDPMPDNLARLASMLVDLGFRRADLGDFEPKEFPFDPTDARRLAEGENVRSRPLGDLDVMQWTPGDARRPRL